MSIPLQLSATEEAVSAGGQWLRLVMETIGAIIIGFSMSPLLVARAFELFNKGGEVVWLNKKPHRLTAGLFRDTLSGESTSPLLLPSS